MAQCDSVLHFVALDLRPFVSSPVIGSLSTSGKILAPKVVHKSLKDSRCDINCPTGKMKTAELIPP